MSMKAIACGDLERVKKKTIGKNWWAQVMHLRTVRVLCHLTQRLPCSDKLVIERESPVNLKENDSALRYTVKHGKSPTQWHILFRYSLALSNPKPYLIGFLNSIELNVPLPVHLHPLW